MQREELVDLNAFLTVAEERSFTRVAAKLGTLRPALDRISAQLASIKELREKPVGTIRTLRRSMPPIRSYGRRWGGCFPASRMVVSS